MTISLPYGFVVETPGVAGFGATVDFDIGFDFGFAVRATFFSLAASFASVFAVSCLVETTAPVFASTITSSTPDFPRALMSYE